MEFEKLQSIIAEVLNAEPEEIKASASFVDDLGADSLDIFQIIMGIEDAFDIEIDKNCHSGRCGAADSECVKLIPS